MTALKTPSVPALERALSILEALGQSRNGLTLLELTRRLALPKSSTHCLLLTLERHGYLHRNQNTGRYMFGLKLHSLAKVALTRIEVREQAKPFLYVLMEKTKLTVHMAILEANQAILVDNIYFRVPFRIASWVGKQMDVHCTGLGKALIAYLPEEQLDGIMKSHGLSPHNDNTIVSVKKLKENLNQARLLGYFLDDEEEEIGLRGIGTPIFDHMGGVTAAISVAGTTAQVRPENLSMLAEKVKHTGLEISQELGFDPNATDS